MIDRISMDFAGLRSVVIGTSRPFAVTQQCGRFRGEVDMPREAALVHRVLS
jgi:hypothetical protein